MLPALQSRNFRLYLYGQFVSLIGTWMQQLASSWLVYKLTGSVFWSGLTAFASMVPNFLIGLFTGVLVDRLDKRKLLLWTQSLAGFQALILAVLTLSHRVTIAEIIGLSFFLGLINALDMPARQSFVIQLVNRRSDLPNAIALNSSVLNGTRLLGPSLAGITIAYVGEGFCFLINALSYVGVLIALFLIKVDRPKRSKPAESLQQAMKIGLRFVMDAPPILATLIFLSLMNLFAMPYTTLFPAMASQILGGDAGMLGQITTSAAVGALCSTLFVLQRKNVLRLGLNIVRAGFGFSFGLMALAYTKTPATMFPCLLLTGATMMFQMGASNIIIQTLVDDDKRGRVMSLFAFSMLGVAPFGSLLLGWIADRVGIHFTLLLCGGLSLLFSIVFLLRIEKINPYVRRRYEELGILTPDTSHPHPNSIVF